MNARHCRRCFCVCVFFGSPSAVYLCRRYTAAKLALTPSLQSTPALLYHIVVRVFFSTFTGDRRKNWRNFSRKGDYWLLRGQSYTLRRLKSDFQFYPRCVRINGMPPTAMTSSFFLIFHYRFNVSCDSIRREKWCRKFVERDATSARYRPRSFYWRLVYHYGGLLRRVIIFRERPYRGKRGGKN